MIFKKLSMEYSVFSIDDIEEIQTILDKHCQQYDGPMSDLSLYYQNKSRKKSLFLNNKKQYKGGMRRDISFVVRDSITALALCHNVTPVYT